MTARLTEDEIATSYSALHGWCATLSSYDGSPDAIGRDSLIGCGNTEQQAIDDLKRQLPYAQVGRGLFMQGGS